MNIHEKVIHALQTIRAPLTTSEYDLHAIVSQALTDAGLTVFHEVVLAPRKRIDFLCETVGVEVKRGKPRRAMLLKQLAGYAQSEAVGSLVLIAEHPPKLPPTLCGKVLKVVNLSKLWGIAL